MLMYFLTHFTVLAAFPSAIWKLFDRIETLATDETREKVIDILRHPENSVSSWPQTFADLFDTLFGNDHFSPGCFVRSCAASFFSTFLMIIFWASLDNTQERLTFVCTPSAITASLSLFLFINIIPDYFSLFETRAVIRWIGDTRLVTWVLAMLILDFIITASIAAIAVTGPLTEFILITIMIVIFLLCSLYWTLRGLWNWFGGKIHERKKESEEEILERESEISRLNSEIQRLQDRLENAKIFAQDEINSGYKKTNEWLARQRKLMERTIANYRLSNETQTRLRNELSEKYGNKILRVRTKALKRVLKIKEEIHNKYRMIDDLCSIHTHEEKEVISVKKARLLISGMMLFVFMIILAVGSGLIYITAQYVANHSISIFGDNFESISFFSQAKKLIVDDAILLQSGKNKISIGVFFYSTFSTSIWVWLYGLSVLTVIFFRKIGFGINYMRKKIEIDKQPIRFIGDISAVITFVFLTAFWAWHSL